jgi:hypothetical protein
MKTITPQPIWVDGISKLASVIFSQVNSDNMKDTATFYFQLYQEVDVNIVPLVNGTINMTGTDYTTYNSSSDANDYAWTWIATTLGLTITGEYIPPPTPAELEQANATELEQPTT